MANEDVILSSLSAIATERDEALSLLSKISGDMFQLLGSEANSLRLLTGCSSLVQILERSVGDENGPCGEWARFLSHIFNVMSGMTNLIKGLEQDGYVCDGSFVECPKPPSPPPSSPLPPPPPPPPPSQDLQGDNKPNEGQTNIIGVIDEVDEIVSEGGEDGGIAQGIDKNSTLLAQIADQENTILSLKQELCDLRRTLEFVHDERLFNNNDINSACLLSYQKQLQHNLIDKRRVLLAESKARNAESMNIELRKQVDELFSLAYAVEKKKEKSQMLANNEKLATPVNTSTIQELRIILQKHELVLSQQRKDIARLGSLLHQMNLLRKLEVQKIYEVSAKLREELFEVKKKLARQVTYSYDLEMELTLHGLNTKQVSMRDYQETNKEEEEEEEYAFLNHTNVQAGELRSHEMLARAVYLHSKRHEWCLDESNNKAIIHSILASHPSNNSLTCTLSATVPSMNKQDTRDYKEECRGQGQEEGEEEKVSSSGDKPSPEVMIPSVKLKAGNSTASLQKETISTNESNDKDKFGKESLTSDDNEIMDPNSEKLQPSNPQPMDKENMEKADFLNNISRNWNLLGLGAMDEFLNETYSWDPESGDLIGMWGEVETLEPPPPHSLNSPLVNEVLCQWTGDIQRQKALTSWMSQIIDERQGEGNPKKNVPTLQLTKLNRDSLGGFLALVFPLLLRRQDIAVEVSTRERRTTAYDVRVQVTKLSKKKKHMTVAAGMLGSHIMQGGDNGHTAAGISSNMKRSSSETSLPQQYGRSFPSVQGNRMTGERDQPFNQRSQSSMMLSPRGEGNNRLDKGNGRIMGANVFVDSANTNDDNDMEKSVDDETWRTWHHLALRAAIMGHIEMKTDDLLSEEEDSP